MDDYILILRAKTKDELIKLANIINKELNEWITNNNLTLDLDKTEIAVPKQRIHKKSTNRKFIQR